jgi:hypothetical protein
MLVAARLVTLSAMLATVAWFFWNPVGWTFDWEPVVVFLFALSGYLTTEYAGFEKGEAKIHPSDEFLFRSFLEVLPSKRAAKEDTHF